MGFLSISNIRSYIHLLKPSVWLEAKILSLLRKSATKKKKKKRLYKPVRAFVYWKSRFRSSNPSDKYCSWKKETRIESIFRVFFQSGRNFSTKPVFSSSSSTRILWILVDPILYTHTHTHISDSSQCHRNFFSNRIIRRVTGPMGRFNPTEEREECSSLHPN